MPLKGKFRLIGLVAVAVIVILGITVATFDWNLLRGFVSNRVSAATGRHFAINGDLDVRPGITPTIRAEQVVLDNAPWASSREMADIDVLEFRVNLWQLIKGNIVIPELSLIRPSIILERKDGKNNWTFGTQTETNKEPSKLPEIGQLNIRSGVIYYREPDTNTFIKVAISTLSPNLGQKEASIAFQGSGHLRGQNLALHGQSGSLLSLDVRDTPYPVDVKGRIGDTSVEAKGTVTDPLRLAGVDIDFRVQGKDLSRLGDISGMPVPATPPYALAAHLGHQSKTWSLADLKASLGNSRFSGSAALELGRERPLVRGDVMAEYLDLSDLTGLAAKQTPKAPVGQQNQATTAEQQNKRMFSEKPYNLVHLRNADADIQFEAKQIKQKTIQVNDMAGHITLDKGVLTLSPLNFGVAGGNVNIEAALDARNAKIRGAADITVRGVGIQKLFPKTKITKETEVHQETAGQFGGKAYIVINGNSPAEMAASANGNLSLIMSGGRVSDLLVEILELDIGAALLDFLGGDVNIPMHCAVIDTKITNGKMKVNTFFIDTEASNITGDGSIDLGKESINFAFHTKPKDISIVTTSAPLYVKGSLEKPDFAVDKTMVAGRVGAAVALGALVTPLAALVPLIDLGQGSHASCADVIDKVGKNQNNQGSNHQLGQTK